MKNINGSPTIMENNNNYQVFNINNRSRLSLLTNGNSNNKNINQRNVFIKNNGNHAREINGNHVDDKFEIPLPFGYHMDLDFLRFCSGELVSGETLERLKELRKQRRKQRKTLEALMGIKQEQRNTQKEKLIRELKAFNFNANSKPCAFPDKRNAAVSHHQLSLTTPDVVGTPDFVKDALKDAMDDFERTLERSKEDRIGSGYESTGEINLMSSTPNTTKCARFNTFPRSLSSPDEQQQQQQQQHATSTYKLFRENSNSSISSISTSSSAFPYIPNGSPDAVLAGLPSSVPPKMNADILETDSIVSITSEMSTTTLKNIREQMAKSLQKLKEYEKQVEAIPVMHVKLSVLKEEKRLLMLKLKQRELQMRRERGELEESDGAFNLDYESEEEDFEDGGKLDQFSANKRFQHLTSRARSESPYARGGIINPDDFISMKKRRGGSCGYNSDSDLITPMTERYNNTSEFVHASRSNLSKSSNYQNLSTPHIGRAEFSVFPQRNRRDDFPEKNKVVGKEVGINTDPMPEPKPIEIVKEVVKVKSPPLIRKRDRASNTDPPPKSPPPPRKVTHGTNTVSTRTINRSSGTSLQMNNVVTKDEMESKIQEAIFKTEEEIMGCPLLQKAMAKVEEEAIHGPSKDRRSSVSTGEMSCQVGDENLRPFVISVGLQCKLDQSHPLVYDSNLAHLDSDSDSLERRSRVMDLSTEKLVRSIGVGECKVIEEPTGPKKFREIGICTEKWVEIIKASKQTDTEDFAFKDTESPRVADLFFEPSPERVVLERRSSLRRTNTSSPSLSRKSSYNSPAPSRRSSTLSTTKPITRSQGTMTYTEVREKVPTKDAKTGATVPTKTVGTSAMTLNLTAGLPAPGSPLATPDRERPKVNLCDKCDTDIHKVAQGIMDPPITSPRIQPPSPDMPWLSKIPRPVPENPDVFKIKSATSIDNLSLSPSNRSRSPMMQRSKSSLTPGQSRKLISPLSPMFGGRNKDVGTPPPHPSTPPVGSRRIPSPLARSQSPYSQAQEKRSLIPKLSPGPLRKQMQQQSPAMSKSSSSPLASSPLESKSFIPRVVTPPALRKMYPKADDKLATPDRNVVRKNTFTKLNVGVISPELEGDASSTKSGKALEELKKKLDSVVEEKDKIDPDTSSSGDEGKSDEAAMPKGFTSKGFPLPGVALFAPIDTHRTKAEPSKEMRAALKVLNDSLGRSTRGNAQVTNAINIIQQEWFKISSTKQSNPLDVEDYLDVIEDMSKDLLVRVVNLTDVNGNSALHYSVSHGNFDVVSVLLDSKVANPNIMNKAGYTCIMLISLAKIQSSTHRAVVARLFSLGDVNIRATQHGQTALMLAVSHGRSDMVQLLVEASADINIRDEDGSTALMCAAEHGHMEIVKFLLQHPETNVLAKDNDGLTALAVAMEAGHRDVGVILYANMSFSRGASPYSSMRMKKGAVTGPSSRTSTPTAEKNAANSTSGGTTSVTPTPPFRARRNSSNQ